MTVANIDKEDEILHFQKLKLQPVLDIVKLVLSGKIANFLNVVRIEAVGAL